MNIKEFLKKYGINVDAELLINIIMLLIPGVRIVGAFWMYSRIQRKYGFMGLKKLALLLLAILIATGTIGEFFTDVFWPMTIAALAVAAAYFFISRQNGKLGELYACLIGRDSVSLDQLNEALELKDAQIERYIRLLKKQGKLPATTYIDKANRLLVITPEGRPEYRATKPKKEETPKAAPQEDTSPISEKTKYDKILYQIRYINEQISDKAMSEKIYHIENTTANIFHLVEQRPERANEIQTFMEYYLPTTMNLLYKYSQIEKQGNVNSESIQTAKRNIEGIMDKLVEGFDTQLDKLFRSDAIDITNDVKVLEKMMQMDHLNK